MAIYFTRGKYSNQAFVGMMSQPQDRGIAAKAMFHAVGIVCHSIHFSSSNGDIVCIVEGNADQMTQIGAITMASGAFQQTSSEELITTAAMASAITSAAKAMGAYKAPHA